MWRSGALFCSAGILLVLAAVALLRPTYFTPSVPALTVDSISPRPGASGSIEAEPSRMVPVMLVVRNSGARTITGLSAKPECACNIKRTIAAVLKPSQRSTLELELPSPPAGTVNRQIIISAQGHAEPIHTITIPIHVPVNAPAWLDRADHVSGSAIIGHEQTMEILLEAIEHEQAAPWVGGVSVEPREFGSAKLSVQERRWTDDDSLLIRSYRIHLSTIAQAPGVHEATIILQGDGNTPALKPVRVRFDALSALWATPEKLVLNCSTSPRATVAVVSRVSTGMPIIPEFDRSLLEVVKLPSAGEGRVVFEITPQGVPAREMETKVEFSMEREHATRIDVTLLP